MRQLLFIKHLLTPLLWILPCCLLLALVFKNVGYTHNRTISEPRGYYLTFKSKINQGDVYMICLSKAKMPYLLVMEKLGLQTSNECDNGYIPLLKKIVGIPGDIINVTNNGVKVNGSLLNNSIAISQYKKINLLPITLGWSHRLGTNEYWVAGGDIERSYDSRYFGVVNSNEIMSRAVLVFKE